MKLKKSLFFLVCFYFLFNSSCKKENTNLVAESEGLDPHVPAFFNAVGLPLQTLNGNDVESITEDLIRVSPLFTNANPSSLEHSDISSYDVLAKNVGLYFTSQIWKTQLTSPDDVKFFDLNKDVNDAASGIKYDSVNFDLPYVFLNPYADRNDPKNYLGSIQNGVYGKFIFNTAELKPLKFKFKTKEKEFKPLSHFYIMEYKLRDENGSRHGKNVRKYYALVSIPGDIPIGNKVAAGRETRDGYTSKHVRLIMYGHAGDTGTSPAELILIFNEKLKDFVVVAPLFPGEPLCTQIAVQGKGCFRLDENKNLVKDAIGQYTNPNLNFFLNSIVPVAYPRSPLDEDVHAFLGAHNAVSRIMNLPLDGKNPLYDRLLKIEHPEELINYFQKPDKNSQKDDLNKNDVEEADEDPDEETIYMVPTGYAPQTIGVGASRGGGVLIAGIARLGFLISGMPEKLPEIKFNHTVQEDGKDYKFQYPLFNAAAVFFSPSSMLTGKLRLFTIMLLQNKIDAIANIPITQDLAHNKYFTNFRNDKNYSLEIQPPIKNLNGFIPSDDSLTQLVTFVATNDITFLAPYLASGLQNWNSFKYKKAVRAPGSLILLHGSQDLVIPLTESTIAAQAMNKIWGGIYHTPIDPFGNYLDDSKFKHLNEPLKLSFIPGVGTALYTFQPTNEFFNVPCEKNLLAAIQQPDVIYNSDVGRCFGGGYSPHADGKETVGRFYGHTEASFFTGRLVNEITLDNLHMSLLSSNLTTNNDTNYVFEYDKRHLMKYGGYAGKVPAPTDDNYTIPPLSPTFMRYLSEEGTLSPNIVAAKKQIFSGVFKPDNNSQIKPHDVFFAWLESVTCDLCELDKKYTEPFFQTHFGVFHDFSL